MQKQTHEAMRLLRKGDAEAARKIVAELGLDAPGVLELVPLLAHELYFSGRAQAARTLARDALRAAPDNADLNALVGNIELSDGKPEEAVPYLEKAIRLDPKWQVPRLYLADALHGMARPREAVDVLRKLAARGDSVPLRQRLCQFHLDLGEPEAALAHAKRALTLNASDPSSLELMGRALLAAGDADRASDLLAALVRDRPQDPMHRLFLARAMRIRRRLPEALEVLGEAADLKGAPAAVYTEYVDVALQLDRRAEALIIVEKARSRGMRDIGLLKREGRLRRQLADFPGAAAAFGAICRDRPDDLFTEFQHRMNFSVVPEDEAEIDRMRREAAAVLDEIAGREFGTDEPLLRNTITPFYFAYHDHDDLDLNARFSRAYRTLFRRQLEAAQRAADDTRPALRPGSRPRIGVISSFLRSHTIARLNELLLRHLAGTEFQLVLVRGIGSRDHVAQRLDRCADEHHVLPAEFTAAAETVARLRLDVIFYPELAIEPLVYALAHLRLARSQITTWGHPVSSGIDTIDCFLSSRRFEPSGSEASYSERLVQFDDANLYFDVAGHRRELADAAADDRGGSPGPPKFGCLQSAFKFHPAFDRLLCSLLAQDPAFHAYLVEDSLGGHMSARLRRRLERTLGPHMAQVIFLPAMTRHEFLQVCRNMTCMLDIPSFSGGNTTLESFGLGKPVVTMPSRYLKGRLTAGMYAQMGIDGLVAGDADEYVGIAARLAGEPALRAEMRERIRTRLDRLLPAEQHLAEVERFFGEQCRRG